MIFYWIGSLEPDKVLYVVEDTFALLDGAQDGGEVVVEQHHVGRLLADIWGPIQ